MMIVVSTSQPGEYQAVERHPSIGASERNTQHQAPDEPPLTWRSRKELVDHCASICRLLKAQGHSDFINKDAIVQHLRRTIEEKGWLSGDEAGQLKGFSDLPTDSLSEYAVLLQQELERLKIAS